MRMMVYDDASLPVVESPRQSVWGYAMARMSEGHEHTHTQFKG